MAKKLYIIDGHAHIYAAYYAPMRPLNSPSGEPTKAAYVFTTAMLGVIERDKPDMMVVAMDSKGPTFRSEIYSEYKAHRPPMPEDLPSQIARIEQILDAMNIPILRIDGFEADDIIGTVAAKAASDGIDTYICSKDKDMLQLIGKHVFTYDIKKSERIDEEKMITQMGVRPGQFIDVLALQGDKVDNVPGVADVGPKTALDWIRKYDTIENLYEHADEIKGKRGDNLRSSKKLVTLSKELVTINCRAPVKIDYDAWQMTEPDKNKTSKLFSELGFTRLLDKLGIEKAEAAESDKKKDKSAGVKKVKKDYKLIDSKEKFDKFFKELKKQKLFAIDTETTSLDPMRAELVGASFCWKAGVAYYVPVKAPMGQKFVEKKYVVEKLTEVLADEKIRKVGQNIKYDMLVLEQTGIELKGIYFDTMVASYCLAAERQSHSMDAMAKDYLDYETMPISALIGKGKNQLTFDMVDTTAACEYAAEDADITLQLYEYLSTRLDGQKELKKLFKEVEMPLVSVLARMEANGVSLDVSLLHKMSHELAERLDKLTDEIYTLAGGVFNIDSPKQLAEILFDRLGLNSIKSGKTQRSTDAGVLEQLAYQHEIIPLIIEYRQLVKLKNTYLDKLGQLINPRTNRVHASFNQTVTATGRLSSSDPNLQNIPIRTELGRKIRAAFVPAQKTDCILSADYSQIELRLLAHFSQDKALKKAFAQDKDIHRFVASQIYGVEVEDVTSEMRSNCKAVNFGIIYGQGAYGLSRTIGISITEAKKFIEDYFKRYSSIREFMESAIAKSKESGYAETLLGRRRAITGLGSRNFNTRSQAERLAINTIIQGTAADLIKVAMINIQQKIDNQKLPVKMTLQIHDELVFELPKKEAKDHGKWISDLMIGAMKLDVPLKVDVNIGPSWLNDK